ncbi:MAG: hypothetical protein KatS3mg131_3710 [Candidatus Tectimicrobiota bacterium]|nr:MAG: hypothetical protein KatS3mg131_3710 [Candidatus Tectomicrobia bacterium]
MRGTKIESLQQSLKELGYYEGMISGQFDEQTVQAVKQFQQDYRLQVDGIVGRQTWIVLRHFGAVPLAETT